MNTNIVINDEVMSRALAVSGLKTGKEVIEAAITEFVARRERGNLLNLFGSGLIDDDYDYKAMRERRL